MHAANDNFQLGLDDWRLQFAPDIIGNHADLLDALETLKSVADTDCTVLITGDSGTGKELAARALHAASSRAKGPFVAINCAAIPESLVEAELFGHARGAFTGATAARPGLVAAAAGGTLFLDEIGDMPVAAQAKLLRLLQERTITPVGADAPVDVDVRIVAATNRDLEAMVDASEFRCDLYYRLSVIPVELPNLRDRAGDIPELAQSFIDSSNKRHGRAVSGLDRSALQALSLQAWPGNIRQLSHLIERAVLLKRHGQLTQTDLRLRKSSAPTPMVAASANDNLDLRSAISQVERHLIDQALERTNGNRTEAAALLGLNRTTLVEKIRKHAV